MRGKEEHIMNINMCFGGGGKGKMTKNIFYIWKERGRNFKGEGDVYAINSEVWKLMCNIFWKEESIQ